MRHSMYLTGAALIWATSASAHPGAHLHPHDGASWLAMIGGLVIVALAGRLSVIRFRARK